MVLFLEFASFCFAFWAIEVAIRLIRSNPGETTYRAFFVAGLLSGLYGIFYGFIFAVEDKETVLLIYRLSVLSWGFLPAAFFVFIKRFIARMSGKNFNPILYLAYLPAVFFVILGLSGNLLARDFLRIQAGWKELDLYSTVFDYLYLVYIAGYFLYCIFDLFLLTRRLRDRRKRNLNLQVTIPLLLTFLMSILMNLGFAFFENIKIPAIGHFWISTLVIGIGYFMLKVRFLTFSPQLLAGDVFELMTDIAVVADNNNRVLQISRAGLEYWGIRGSRTGRSGKLGIEMDDILEGLPELPPPGVSVSGFMQLKSGDGKFVPFNYVLKTIPDYFNRSHGIFFLARNAEDYVRLERKTGRLQSMNSRLKVLSETDPLTGLINRLKFGEILSREMKKAERYNQPLALIMFDLDDFKHVNDTWGHGAGDEVLKGIASVAGKVLREFDSFCRWGGEEFLILCPNSEIKGTKTLAERLRKSIEELSVGGVRKITASFGLSELKYGETMNEFLERADVRLYQAKEKGKNVIVTKN